MINFTDQQPITAPKTARVSPARKDGKHPVSFYFPISGRLIKKLIPAAELETKTAGYVVIHTR